jgi:hypothetical protein
VSLTGRPPFFTVLLWLGVFCGQVIVKIGYASVPRNLTVSYHRTPAEIFVFPHLSILVTVYFEDLPATEAMNIV